MKFTRILIVVTALFGLLGSSFVSTYGAEPKQAKEAKKTKKAKLRHVVAFKFKETATPEQIKKVEEAFAELPKKISTIDKFEWGTNNSPEKRNKGCSHCFILTFKTEKDRDDYLVHPAHKEFGSLVGPVLDDVFVLDYWAKK